MLQRSALLALLVSTLLLLLALVSLVLPAGAAPAFARNADAGGALGLFPAVADADADEKHALFARQAKKTTKKKKTTTKKIKKTTKKAVKKTTSKAAAVPTTQAAKAPLPTTAKAAGVPTTAKAAPVPTTMAAPNVPITKKVVATTPAAPVPTTKKVILTTQAPPAPPPAAPTTTKKSTAARTSKIAATYGPLSGTPVPIPNPGPHGTMTFCGGVSTSITTSQTAVVTVSLPAATAVPSNVQIIADLQSVYSTKTNIYIEQVASPFNSATLFFGSSDSCFNTRTTAVFSDDGTGTSCALPIIKPASGAISSLNLGNGGLFRIKITYGKPLNSPSGVTLFDFCIKATYPDLPAPPPPPPSLGPSASKCNSYGVNEGFVVNAADSVPAGYTDFKVSVTGTGNVSSMIAEITFKKTTLVGVDPWFDIYIYRYDYFAENYIYLFNNGVDSNSTAAATNGITWVFRDDGYVSSKYATNTDLYPQSAFSNFYGYPVAGEWTVEFTNDNAAEAKVDKICLYFNGAEPA